MFYAGAGYTRKQLGQKQPDKSGRRDESISSFAGYTLADDGNPAKFESPSEPPTSAQVCADVDYRGTFKESIKTNL
ncbi:MAG: hypothetical protein LBC56_06185 [Oscillospiraceae bacterium]|nr:hypothetical protein [Oscillospiraceae bacterium]